MFCFFSWAYSCRLKIKIFETTSARSRRAGKFSQSRKLPSFAAPFQVSTDTYLNSDFLLSEIKEKKRNEEFLVLLTINSARVTDVNCKYKVILKGFFIIKSVTFLLFIFEWNFPHPFPQTTFHNALWRSLCICNTKAYVRILNWGGLQFFITTI